MMIRRGYPVIIGKNLKKGILTGEKDGRRSLIIVWLKRQFKTGESFKLEDVEKVDTQLWFCDKESLKATIDALTELYDDWEKEGDEDG